VLVIHDAQSDENVGDNAYLVTNGIDFYAGAPLVLPNGSCVGALVLMDYEAREFSAEDEGRLREAAAELVQRFAVDKPPVKVTN
jgi:GAF domain-containing protein